MHEIVLFTMYRTHEVPDTPAEILPHTRGCAARSPHVRSFVCGPAAPACLISRKVYNIMSRESRTGMRRRLYAQFRLLLVFAWEAQDDAKGYQAWGYG